jgi:twitching motility protein PilT
MEEMTNQLDELCRYMVEQGAADLFLDETSDVTLRVFGELATLEGVRLEGAEMDRLWEVCGIQPSVSDADGTYVSGDGHRFRVNFLRFLGRRRAILRHVKSTIPDLIGLGLPEELLQGWMARKGGLVLVCGPTASGKSTTIAACLNWVNQTLSRHIVTIEDPVEYLFQRGQSFFSQREVGIDTESFAMGLRQALRQSPDVIFVGEIRDQESAVTALRAAEVGHTVVTTLHSSSCPEALERLVRLFPERERDGISVILANQLTGVLCQRLLPATDGAMVLVAEHFQNQGLSRRLILEGKWTELADFIERGEDDANCSMLARLAELCEAGRLTLETASKVLPNPQDLKRALHGISSV